MGNNKESTENRPPKSPSRSHGNTLKKPNNINEVLQNLKICNGNDDADESYEEIIEEEPIIPDDVKALSLEDLRTRYNIATGKICVQFGIRDRKRYEKALVRKENSNLKDYGSREAKSCLDQIKYLIDQGRKVTIGNKEMLKLKKVPHTANSDKDYFVYFLIDATMISNLEECSFEEFIKAIFYVGKGNKMRPLEHLKNVARVNNNIPIKGNEEAEKLKRIKSIWDSGSGVVILNCFSFQSEEQSQIRESAIIHTLGLENLTNERNGKLDEKWLKEELGAASLYKAWNIFKNSECAPMYEKEIRYLNKNQM